jgi:hypothetical protein
MFGTSVSNGICYYFIRVGRNDSSKYPGFTRVIVKSGEIEVYMKRMNGTTQNLGTINA